MSTAPRTLLIGRDGLIGGHLYRMLSAWDPLLFATSYRRDSEAPFLDLTLPHNHDWGRLQAEGYRYAILSAGSARLSYCETHPTESALHNLEAPLRLAGELSAAGICPVLFSTDYVFDGLSGGYDDAAPTHPLNVYGRQKAELEARLPGVCGEQYLCLRLSKVYTTRRGDGTLLDEMLGKLSRQQPVYAATDQVMSPILIDDALQAMMALLQAGARGLYNLCAPEIWSRYELACLLAESLGRADGVQPIRLADLHESFARPQRTDLRCRRLTETARIDFTPLRDSARKLAQAYLDADGDAHAG